MGRYHASVECVVWDPGRPGTAVPIILKLRDDAGYLQSHSTPLIVVEDPNGNAVVPSTAMTFDSALNQSTYYFQTGDSYVQGTYQVKCSCVLSIGGNNVTFRGSAKFRLSEVLD